MVMSENDILGDLNNNDINGVKMEYIINILILYFTEQKNFLSFHDI